MDIACKVLKHFVDISKYSDLNYNFFHGNRINKQLVKNIPDTYHPNKVAPSAVGSHEAASQRFDADSVASVQSRTHSPDDQ